MEQKRDRFKHISSRTNELNVRANREGITVTESVKGRRVERSPVRLSELTFPVNGGNPQRIPKRVSGTE